MKPSAYVVKRRTTVRVSQPGEEPLDGEFCLAVESADLRRAETLLDLLNSPRTMVPFVRSGDQRVSLLVRSNIDWVVAGDTVPRELIYPPHYVLGFEELVQVFFLDGRVIEGLLQAESDPLATRASDFLNSAADFFPIVTRLGTLLANKSRTRETLLVESRDATRAQMPGRVETDAPRPPR